MGLLEQGVSAVLNNVSTILQTPLVFVATLQKYTVDRLRGNIVKPPLLCAESLR